MLLNAVMAEARDDSSATEEDDETRFSGTESEGGDALNDDCEVATLRADQTSDRESVTQETAGLCPDTAANTCNFSSSIVGTSNNNLSANTPSVQPGKVRLRLRTDSFYDDYLHRGGLELGPHGKLVETPLHSMSYYTYGMWVRVVEGDPDDLAACQFAFAAHHTKYANYVQELRKTPVVPYLHGFTMPTREKDAETNACLKQVLLRPHHCSGRNKCRSIEFTSAFSEPTTIRGNNRGATTELCFSMCCKRYLAGQKNFGRAGRSQVMHFSDVACLAGRCWSAAVVVAWRSVWRVCARVLYSIVVWTSSTPHRQFLARSVVSSNCHEAARQCL